jgi:hypothetical protein
MGRSLFVKLTLALLAVGLTGALLVALFAGRTTTVALRGFALEQSRENFIDDVTGYYQLNHSWEGAFEFFRRQAPPRPLEPNRREPLPPRLEDARLPMA